MLKPDPQPLAMIPLWGEGPFDDPGSYCCVFMEQQLDGHCRGPEGHFTNTIQCPDQIICYDAKLRDYSLSPLGPSPSYSISYCPSCGTKLPEDLREEWFAALEGLGIDPWDKAARPIEYNTDKWWKERGL